ncbi:hypothetical protein FC36_GL001946 [Ligilactobacillus equi DSM 15833 = JCM 10991]|uniref:Uncharacterized protein n=2 Tax=Ligilactobacillus equi TaxID=137357 RepID=A0A0R1T4Y0_9LACO|nr:hypothetical protein FC36_GL001946 [Ligilactobacillus equi DSM 15833 = JCM 10991]
MLNLTNGGIKMRPRKIIASDMDMTFLKSDGSYNQERFTKLLDRLDEAQIRFAVASGRSYWMVEDIFQNISARIDCIAENGAYVRAQGQEIAKQLLTVQQIRDFEEFFLSRSKNYFILISSAKQMYYIGDLQEQANQGLMPADWVKLFSPGIKVASFDQVANQDEFIKVTAMVPEAEVDSLIAEYNQSHGDDLRAVQGGHGAIDFVHGDCHKAWGLEQLLQHYHLNKEDLIVFGDNLNDLEMMQAAGTSYAVANAKEPIKAVATKMVPSNDDEGVLAAIEGILAEI